MSATYSALYDDGDRVMLHRADCPDVRTTRGCYLQRRWTDLDTEQTIKYGGQVRRHSCTETTDE